MLQYDTVLLQYGICAPFVVLDFECIVGSSLQLSFFSYSLLCVQLCCAGGYSKPDELLMAEKVKFLRDVPPHGNIVRFIGEVDDVDGEGTRGLAIYDHVLFTPLHFYIVTDLGTGVIRES